MHADVYKKAVADFRATLQGSVAGVKRPPQSNVSVNVRVRPLFDHEAIRGEWECISGQSSHGITVVHEATEKVKRNLGKIRVMRNHTFACSEFLGNDITDETLYERAASQLTSQATLGKSSTIFMYGMTGSGKTYSMSAIHKLIAPHIWQLAPGITVQFTSYELIGKRCFDLMAPVKPHPEVLLRMGEDGILAACGAIASSCKDPQELLERLMQASAARETCATGTNASSSRSHAVYKLQLDIPGRKSGAITMIDLAGNEGSIESFFHDKAQMAATAEINSSLSTLKECLRGRANGSAYVPYRESTLTRVLQGALSSDDAFISVVATVSPTSTHMEHSLNTLKTVSTLTGGDRKPSVVEVELTSNQVVAKVELVPQKWDAKQTQAWIAKSEFKDLFVLPAGTTGAALMKLTAVRLTPMCGGNSDVAKALFAALRAESNRVKSNDAAMRQQMKAGGKKIAATSSYGFAKVAPTRPVVSRK